MRLILCNLILLAGLAFGQQNVAPTGAFQDLSSRNIHELPKNIVNNPSVSEIDFSDNPYFDLADSVLMPNVIKLKLSRTIVNPWELDQIGKAFPNLEVLDLSSCGISFIGSKMQTFGRLKELNLANNTLTNIPYEFQSLSNLTTLNLSNNDIKTGTINLSYLRKLVTLNLSNNEKLESSVLLTSIQNNQRLRYLSMSSPTVSLATVELLPDSIQELTLDHITSALPAEFSQLKTVKKLSISNSAINEAGFAPMTRMPGLSQVSISGSRLPRSIVGVRKLDSLTLQQNNEDFTQSLTVLQQLALLKKLDLSGSDFRLEQLADLKKALPNTIIYTGKVELSEEMKANNLPEIIAPPSVNTTISSVEENVIKLRNTAFEIPTNAFLTQDNKVYNGPVQIQAKVYDNALDIALSGAPMTYNENGNDELFSSNGMIDFRARTPDGQELKPNPNNMIMVTMQNTQPGTKPSLFQFQDSSKVWTILPTIPMISYTNPELQRTIDSVNLLDYRSQVVLQPMEPIYELKAKFKGWDAAWLSIYATQESKRTTDPAINGIESLVRFNEPYRELYHKFQFQIDTVLSREQVLHLNNIQFLKQKKDNYEVGNYYFLPRKVWNLKVVPDLAHDNYRLTCDIGDSSYSFPITIRGTETRAIQKGVAAFEMERMETEKKSEHLKLLFEQHRDSVIATAAAAYKARVIAQLQQAAAGSLFAQEQVRFGLSNFGTVNCDYFSRNKPNGRSSLASVLVDQNNQEIKAPESVRVALMDDLTYLNVDEDQIPIYNGKKNYGIIRISETVIGVFAIFGNMGSTIRNIKTINIEGKSSDEVRSLILQE